jgi:3-oxoacyl-[acyl-carrier protein] reductase
MDLELTGKRALVTGATRGIGRAIAERLTSEGCPLAICARGGDEVERAAGELRGRGVAVHAAAVDVTDAPALERFVADAGQARGGLELLVANAGGSAGGERLDDAGAEDWRTTFDLNVVHTAVAARAAVPLMRTAGGRAMVFIASISGLRPQPRAQYAAAKAAEIHLAASLARELGPDGIRVNALSPGSILFPGGGWDHRRASDPEAFEQWIRDEFPLGRLGRVEGSRTSRASCSPRVRRGSAGRTSSSTARRTSRASRGGRARVIARQHRARRPRLLVSSHF